MLFEKVLGVLGAVLELVFVTRHYRRSGLYMVRYHPLTKAWFYLSKWTGVLPVAYVQHFVDADDPIPHNHPRFFLSLILGPRGYCERRWQVRPYAAVRVFWRRPWRFNWIPASTYHWVEPLDKIEGCWTFVVAGPTLRRKWGFWWRGAHIDSHMFKMKYHDVSVRGH